MARQVRQSATAHEEANVASDGLPFVYATRILSISKIEKRGLYSFITIKVQAACSLTWKSTIGPT